MSTRIDTTIYKTNGGEKVKKVIAIAATFVLGTSMMAMADQTNWAMQIKASNQTGGSFGSSLAIGTKTGATDGIDLGTIAEPGTIVAPPTGATLGMATTKIGTVEAIKDYRAPKAGSAIANYMPSWEIHVYQAENGGANIPLIKVAFTPSQMVYNWTETATGKQHFYGYKLEALTGTWYTDVAKTTVFTNAWFKEANKMATGFALYLDNSNFQYKSYDTGAQLRLTMTPEPGSMLALGSGLAGLLGFAIRRKR